MTTARNEGASGVDGGEEGSPGTTASAVGDADDRTSAPHPVDPIGVLIVDLPDAGSVLPAGPAPGSRLRLGLIDAARPIAGCVVSHPLEPIPADAVRALALTRDGRTAFVAATRSSVSDARARPDPCLSMFDTRSGRLRASAELPYAPNDVAVTADGQQVVCATERAVVLLRVGADRLRTEQTLSIGSSGGAALAILPGGHVLLALSDMGCIAVLALGAAGLSDTGERIVTGSAPTAIDLCEPGAWAAVACAANTSDADDRHAVSLLDLSIPPFRAVQHLGLPAAPTAVALSPDGRWLAVGISVDAPARAPGAAPAPAGGVRLYSILPGRAVPVGEALLDTPVSSLAFGADERGLLLVAVPLAAALCVFSASPEGLHPIAAPVALGGAPLALCAARGGGARFNPPD